MGVIRTILLSPYDDQSIKRRRTARPESGFPRRYNARPHSPSYVKVILIPVSSSNDLMELDRSPKFGIGDSFYLQ